MRRPYAAKRRSDMETKSLLVQRSGRDEPLLRSVFSSSSTRSSGSVRGRGAAAASPRPHHQPEPGRRCGWSASHLAAAFRVGNRRLRPLTGYARSRLPAFEHHRHGVAASDWCSGVDAPPRANRPSASSGSRPGGRRGVDGGLGKAGFVPSTASGAEPLTVRDLKSRYGLLFTCCPIRRCGGCSGCFGACWRAGLPWRLRSDDRRPLTSHGPQAFVA